MYRKTPSFVSLSAEAALMYNVHNLYCEKLQNYGLKKPLKIKENEMKALRRISFSFSN